MLNTAEKIKQMFSSRNQNRVALNEEHEQGAQ